MIAATLLTLATAASGSTTLVEAAFNTSGRSRVEVLEVREARAKGCELSGLEPIVTPARSGVVAVTLVGQDLRLKPCSVSAVARVRVFSRVLVTSRPVKAGEPLEGAVTALEREQLDEAPRLGPDQLPANALAAQALAANTALAPRHLRDDGPQNGEPVRVVVLLNGVRLVQEGHASRCPTAGLMCARLPNGHRVEGVWRGGELEVAP